MTNVSDKTIERYVSIWKGILKSKIPLKDFNKTTQKQFQTKSGLKGKAQFNLAKALLRNPERQKQVNKILIKRKIPTTKIKRAKEVIYIPKVRKIKAKPITVKAKPKVKVKAKPKVKPKPKPKPPKPPKVKPKTITISQLPSVIRKGSQYGIVEVIDDNNESYWIKYEKKRDFNRQFDILKQFYPITKVRLRHHGFKPYREFTDAGFQKELDRFFNS